MFSASPFPGYTVKCSKAPCNQAVHIASSFQNLNEGYDMFTIQGHMQHRSELSVANSIDQGPLGQGSYLLILYVLYKRLGKVGSNHNRLLCPGQHFDVHTMGGIDVLSRTMC